MSTAPRVLMLGLTWPPETFLMRLIDGLVGRGLGVTVAVPAPSPAARRPAALPAARGIEWVWLPGRTDSRPRNLWQTTRALAGAARRAPGETRRLVGAARAGGSTIAAATRLRREAPLVGRDFNVIYFPWNSAAIAYQELLDRAPVVISCRGSQINVAPHNPERADLRDGLAATFARAAAVHCVSAQIRDEATRYGLDPGKAVVIRPAVDPELFQPAVSSPLGNGSSPLLPSPPAPLRLITTGSVLWRKGYEYALLAVRALLDRGVAVALRHRRRRPGGATAALHHRRPGPARARRVARPPRPGRSAPSLADRRRLSADQPERGHLQRGAGGDGLRLAGGHDGRRRHARGSDRRRRRLPGSATRQAATADALARLAASPDLRRTGWARPDAPSRASAISRCAIRSMLSSISFGGGAMRLVLVVPRFPRCRRRSSSTSSWGWSPPVGTSTSSAVRPRVVGRLSAAGGPAGAAAARPSRLAQRAAPAGGADVAAGAGADARARAHGPQLRYLWAARGAGGGAGGAGVLSGRAIIALSPDIVHFEFGALAVGRTHVKRRLLAAGWVSASAATTSASSGWTTPTTTPPSGATLTPSTPWGATCGSGRCAAAARPTSPTRSSPRRLI
jgi:hypothetical protein